MTTINCPTCGREVRAGNVCGRCGTPTVRSNKFRLPRILIVSGVLGAVTCWGLLLAYCVSRPPNNTPTADVPCPGLPMVRGRLAISHSDGSVAQERLRFSAMARRLGYEVGERDGDLYLAKSGYVANINFQHTSLLGMFISAKAVDASSKRDVTCTYAQELSALGDAVKREYTTP